MRIKGLLAVAAGALLLGGCGDLRTGAELKPTPTTYGAPSAPTVAPRWQDACTLTTYKAANDARFAAPTLDPTPTAHTPTVCEWRSYGMGTMALTVKVYAAKVDAHAMLRAWAQRPFGSPGTMRRSNTKVMGADEAVKACDNDQGSEIIFRKGQTVAGVAYFVPAGYDGVDTCDAALMPLAQDVARHF